MFKSSLLTFTQKYAQNILAGLGISVILTSTGSAIASTNFAPPSSPLLVAELMNHCDESESVFLEAETENYWLNICGGDYPYDYVGVSKADGSMIRVPLSDYDDQGTYFEAINDDVTYNIVFDTPQGSFLTVTEGDEELLREPLLDW